MSVNSAAVLRLMGKGVGGAAPAGVVRGRGATRGGRGKSTQTETLALKLTLTETLARTQRMLWLKVAGVTPAKPLECLFPLFFFPPSI